MGHHGGHHGGHHHHHGGHHHHHHHHHHSGHYNSSATVYTSPPVVVAPVRPIYTTPLLAGQQTTVVTSSSGYRHKSLAVAYILLIFFGFLGLHRLYLGKTGTFFLYLFTCGVFGIGVIVDIFLLPSMVCHYNEHAFSSSTFGGPVIYETVTPVPTPVPAPTPELVIVTETPSAPPMYQP